MKAKQWTLLLVLLAGVVFGITFATQFVGTGQKKDDKKAGKKTPGKDSSPDKQDSGSNTGNENLKLTFAEREYPPGSPTRKPGEEEDLEEIRTRPATEYERTGYHDFWFSNDTAEEVVIGLAMVSCGTCSDVLVWVAPDAWRKELAEMAARWVAASAPTAPRGHAAVEAALAVQTALADEAIRRLKGGVKEQSMTALKAGSESGQAVPAGRFGFVRMKWTAPLPPEPQFQTRISIQPWYQNSRNKSNEMLQVGIVASRGFHIATNSLDLGELRQGDSATQEILIWSVVHSDFTVDVVSKANFIRCARVEQLTVEEMATLNAPNKILGRVLGACRLHINARERYGDGPGQRADVGPFDQTITIVPSVAGKPQRELYARVQGIVHSDITIDGVERTVVLEPFRVADGARRELTLNSERAGVELKVERAPSFMNVKLEKVSTTGARGQWKLTLEIPPNRVSGRFPRPDVEMFRDTAIYLKMEGETPRRIRIPVGGQALQ